MLTSCSRSYPLRSLRSPLISSVLRRDLFSSEHESSYRCCGTSDQQSVPHVRILGKQGNPGNGRTGRRFRKSWSERERNTKRDLPGGHCSTPITIGSTRRVRKNELKTHRGESNDELGGVDGGNIGNELRYFWCADAVYGRVESCVFNRHALENVHLRETKLRRLPWFVICDHVSLYH